MITLITWARTFFVENKNREVQIFQTPSHLISFSLFSEMDQFFLDCLLANNIRSFLIILYTPRNIHLDSYLALLTLFLLANLIVLYLCLGTWSGFLFWTGSSFAQGHISSYELSTCDFFILLSTLRLHWTVFTCGLSVTSL